MSRECQINRTGEKYGAPADVYAFGLFVYEVLARKRAWTQEDMCKIYEQLYPNNGRGFDERADMSAQLFFRPKGFGVGR